MEGIFPKNSLALALKLMFELIVHMAPYWFVLATIFVAMEPRTITVIQGVVLLVVLLRLDNGE